MMSTAGLQQATSFRPEGLAIFSAEEQRPLLKFKPVSLLDLGKFKRPNCVWLVVRRITYALKISGQFHGHDTAESNISRADASDAVLE